MSRKPKGRNGANICLPPIVNPSSVRIAKGEWLLNCGDYADALVEFEVAPHPTSAMRLLQAIAAHGATIPPALRPWIEEASDTYLKAKSIKSIRRVADNQQNRRRAASLVIWKMVTEGLTRIDATEIVAARLIDEGVPVAAKTIYETWWDRESDFIEGEKQRLANLATLTESKGGASRP